MSNKAFFLEKNGLLYLSRSSFMDEKDTLKVDTRFSFVGDEFFISILNDKLVISLKTFSGKKTLVKYSDIPIDSYLSWDLREL